MINYSKNPTRDIKRGLIISFDIARDEEQSPSLAVASLLAYARSLPNYATDFRLSNHQINIKEGIKLDIDKEVREIKCPIGLENLTLIAISAYIWSEEYIEPIMQKLRKYGFTGDFALGGYQITKEVPIEQFYSDDVRYFISGPGEKSLVNAIVNRPNERVLESNLKLEEFVSPYLTNVLPVKQDAEMVRMETQRGCRWRCSFCSYRGLDEGPVVGMDRERLRNEFKLFAKRNVKKINILDPEFNAGRRCIDTLKIMIEVGLKSKITVQARPENIVKMRWSEEYLELCKLLNIHMEFGLQTAIPREYDAVNRKNNLAQVSQAFFEMNQMGLSYEVSMIYGLPFQTVDSFKQSLKFLEDRDVPIVRCFPLMLHRGTKLDQERDAYDLQELVEPVYGINLVSSSDTFTYDEWLEMNLLANNGKGNFYYKTDHTIPHLEQMKSFT